MIWLIRKCISLTLVLVVVAFGCAYYHQIQSFTMRLVHKL